MPIESRLHPNEEHFFVFPTLLERTRVFWILLVLTFTVSRIIRTYDAHRLSQQFIRTKRERERERESTYESEECRTYFVVEEVILSPE